MGTLALPAQANTSGRYSLLYNAYQQAFLAALTRKLPGGRNAFNRLSLFAGRRGGKTKIGGVATVMKAAAPDQLLWVCAPTYPDLNDFVMPAVFEALPVDWIADYKASFQTIVLTNRTRIQFRSLDDPNKGRGPGLDFCWMDEARKIQQLAWDTILPALADRKGQAIFTTTPNSFDWCYERLWAPAEQGEPGFWACRYKTIDNPFIERAEIESLRKQMDPLFFQQEFEADFVSFAGRIYDIEKAILRTDAEIQAVIPEWPRIYPTRTCFVGLDPGADHPFAGVVIVTTDVGLVVIAEHLQRNRPVMEHVRLLRELLARDNPDRPWAPERWAIDKTQRQTLIELTQYGIWSTPAENKVVDGIRRVQNWLAAGQLFFIERFTPQTIKQLRAYRWAENLRPDGQQKVEAVWKENDDLPDALRYAVMTWPELPEQEIAPSGRVRDISNFTDVEQWAILRNRKLSDPDRERDDELPGLLGEDEGPMGEFYGHPRGYYLEDD